MNKFTKRFFLFFSFIVSPSLITISCNKNNSPINNSTEMINTKTSNNKTGLYNHKNVFPEIHKDSFLKFIRYNSDQKKPYFDKEIIAAFINELITKINILSGDLFWSYKQINPETLEIYVSWVDNKTSLDKTYTFSIVE